MASELRETGDERAVIIEEEADRLSRMVTDLLDISRIRAGALPLDIQINAAEDLVGVALAQLRAVGGEERIRVQLPADGTLLLGRFDFVQTLRSLTNLLENALRYSPPGESVVLDVSRDDPHLVFSVMDRGAGIPAETRRHIFEPFFQPDTGSEKTTSGAGLGLAIARSLAGDAGRRCYGPITRGRRKHLRSATSRRRAGTTPLTTP